MLRQKEMLTPTVIFVSDRVKYINIQHPRNRGKKMNEELAHRAFSFYDSRVDKARSDSGHP